MQSTRQWLATTALVLVLLAGLVAAAPAQNQPGKLDIPTVWRDNSLWVSVRDAAKALDFQFDYLPEGQRVEATRGDHQTAASVTDGSAWMSADARMFVPLPWLDQLGYTTRWDPKTSRAVISWDDQTGYIERQRKTIAVDLAGQVLFARDGDVLVYQFRVSTGKLGYRTPDGDYKVLRKEPMHISSIYPKPRGGARMPYSLWFYDGYFIHGYKEVPHHPASHGCIRLTVPDAKTLFAWTPVGTPVRIYRSATQR